MSEWVDIPSTGKTNKQTNKQTPGDSGLSDGLTGGAAKITLVLVSCVGHRDLRWVQVGGWCVCVCVCVEIKYLDAAC